MNLCIMPCVSMRAALPKALDNELSRQGDLTFLISYTLKDYLSRDLLLAREKTAKEKMDLYGFGLSAYDCKCCENLTF